MSSHKVAIITGISGQMGSYFAEYLINQGIKVIGAVRRLSVPNRQNLGGLSDVIYETMDLGDSHSIESLVVKYKPDYFINCAANSFVGSSWQCPEQHMEYNALGVLRQLEAIRKHSPHTRYVNFGSSEEFGDVVYSPQDENHPARPRSPYGASKVAARQIVKVWRESYGLYAIQCWCFNYESERRGEEFVTRKITKGVARIAKAIKEGKSFEPLELGNLDAKRDWSHAEDFVDGVWRMLNQDSLSHGSSNSPMGTYYGDRLAAIERGVYDERWYSKWLQEHLREYILASNDTHTVREFVEKAFEAAGFSGEWITGPTLHDERFDLYQVKSEVVTNEYTDFDMWTIEGVVRINPAFYRPAEVEILHGDSTAAHTELGWSPKVSFDELVKRMVKSDLADVGL